MASNNGRDGGNDRQELEENDRNRGIDGGADSDVGGGSVRN